MEAVSFGSGSYNKTVKNSGETTESAYVNKKRTSKDSFDKKYKQKTNTKGIRFAATIGLMVASAFAAYKGKDTIKQTLSAVRNQSGKTCSNLKSKFPNMTQSLSYLRKACDTPLKAVKGCATKVKNIFTKVK